MEFRYEPGDIVMDCHGTKGMVLTVNLFCGLGEGEYQVAFVANGFGPGCVLLCEHDDIYPYMSPEELEEETKRLDAEDVALRRASFRLIVGEGGESN